MRAVRGARVEQHLCGTPHRRPAGTKGGFNVLERARARELAMTITLLHVFCRVLAVSDRDCHVLLALSVYYINYVLIFACFCFFW